MQIYRTKRAMAGAVAAAAVLPAETAQAALQDRNLNGDTVVDAFYDTDLDITRLRNANVIGQQTWAVSVAWADGYSFGGYSDWRLPTCDTCIGFNCTGSEMGHLWCVELGNSAGACSDVPDGKSVQAVLFGIDSDREARTLPRQIRISSTAGR